MSCSTVIEMQSQDLETNLLVQLTLAIINAN